MRIPVYEVSIVIPIYNRASFVRQCLLPLTRQSYQDSSYEIIVVDDGSTDETVDLVRTVAREWTGTLRLIQQPNSGPASARNAGINASASPFIAFIDSDCVAEQTWLQTMVSRLVATGCDGLGGPIIEANISNWIGRYFYERRFFRQRVQNNKVDYLLTSNAVFRRSALDVVGGFRIERRAWSEDADLSFRLRKAGFTLDATDQGLVTHHGTPQSLMGFGRTLYRYGRGNAILSSEWKNGRSPAYEITRRLGALVLSPLLALSFVRRVGLLKALSFWPLIAIEHISFLIGYLSGTSSRIKHP